MQVVDPREQVVVVVADQRFVPSQRRGAPEPPIRADSALESKRAVPEGIQ